VAEHKQNTCMNNTGTIVTDENVCTDRANIDHVHVSYLDETQPGIYSVEVKVKINIVVPTTAAESTRTIKTTQSATYDQMRQNINILHKIQRASYTVGDKSAVCGINNTSPNILYYEAHGKECSTEIPLTGLANVASTDNKMVLDCFWDNVYNSSVGESTSYNSKHPQSTCNRDWTLRRKVFDSRYVVLLLLLCAHDLDHTVQYTSLFLLSTFACARLLTTSYIFNFSYLRSMKFKVITSILPRAQSFINDCLNSTTLHTFYEPLPDSYTIDLSHSRYTLVSTINNKNGSIQAPTSEGFVKDLPGFVFIAPECNTITVSDMSR